MKTWNENEINAWVESVMKEVSHKEAASRTVEVNGTRIGCVCEEADGSTWDKHLARLAKKGH